MIASPAEPEPQMPDYMVTYHDFWQELVETNGALDLDKVARELHDFRTLMESASTVYCELADLSKPMTAPHAVIGEARRRIEEEVEEAVREETAELVAERDRLSEALRAMARRSVERRRKARTANRYQLDAMRDYKSLLQKMCSATGVPFRYPARWDYGEVVEKVVAAALRARADRADERAEIARLRAELAQLRASAVQAAGQDQAVIEAAERYIAHRYDGAAFLVDGGAALESVLVTKLRDALTARSAPASPQPPTSEPIPAPTAPPEEDERG